jgi:ribosomal protein S18 acetylase RimI-like enzyme
VSATVVLRPPREDEAAEVARLVNAASRAEHGVDDVSEAEIARWFSQPQVDRERDMFLAQENGRPAAYADVSDSGERGEQFWIDLRLPPDASETAGDALLEAATRRALEVAAERRPEASPRLIADASSTNERAAEVLERAGFRRYRHVYRMAIDLGGDLPEPRFPPGLDVRTFVAGEGRAIFAAVDEAFEDTRDHVPGVFEEWRHWNLEHEAFDPGLWWLVHDAGEIAGLCLCRPYEAEPDLGWVATLAVRRPWRRRGIARALLLTAFHEFKRRGFARVGLGVDADSVTGAHVLYERAGMRPIRQTDVYERIVE